MFNNKLYDKKNQEKKKKDEVIKKFEKKKTNNLLLVDYIVKHVSDKTKDRINICGEFLQFVANKDLSKKKLMAHNGCGNRFCPMCAWRKARKDAMKINTCMKLLTDPNAQVINTKGEILLKEKFPKRFLFLTLTAPNVTGDLLKDEIDKFNYSFKKLMLKKEIVALNKGYVRKLEVTYNQKDNTYHPHFHVVIAVNKSYFTEKKIYLSHDKWLNLWRDVMDDQTITQVNIKAIGENKIFEDNAVSEIAKYTAKDVDYLKSQEVFDVFYMALKGRQEITFNGLFKDAIAMYKKGLLKKYMEIDQTEYIYFLLYRWGFGEYVEAEKRELTEEEKKRINKNLIDEMEIEE